MAWADYMYTMCSCSDVSTLSLFWEYWPYCFAYCVVVQCCGQNFSDCILLSVCIGHC